MSRTLKPLALALGTLLLAGCANPGGLKPQQAPLAANSLAMGRTLSGVPRQTAAWPAADWWHSFHDAQLDHLIHVALASNPDLSVAAARVRQAEAAAAGADAARMPTLGAGVSADGIRIPPTVIGAPLGGHYSTLWRAGLSFNYTFDLWGGQRAQWEAAVDQARAVAVAASAARLQLAADVTRAYVDYAYAGQSVAILKANLAHSQRLLGLTDKRVAAGMDNRMQLATARATLAAASQQLEAAQRGERAAALTLAALCGQGPGFADTLHAPAPLRAAPLALPAALPAELLARRPDVTAALWRVEAEARAIKVARAAFLPNINLAAGLGLASLGAGNLFEAASHYEQFAPAISLPLFDGGRLRANLAGRNAAFDAAVAQYNGVLVQAIHEVADGVSATQSLDRELRAQEQARAATAETWKLAQDQLGAGVISEMQALRVQQALLQADQRLAQLRADRLSAGVSLVVALGGGYLPPTGAPTPANVAEIQP